MLNRTKDNPLVSIVIPTKNSGKTIEKCLKSVISQSYKNIEIIVVDNYSNDKTRDIAKKYCKNVLVKGPERSAQLNFGIKKSNGKYIYRVDSDFLLTKNIIKEAVEKCEKGCDAIVIHNTSDPTISFWSKIRKVERDSFKFDNLNVASRFWRKKVVNSVKGFDEEVVAGDDYDLHNRIVKKGFKIGWINSEETHIGEPKKLSEIVQKHYYYGKNIEKFIRKNPNSAIKQLNPLRVSYLKRIKAFTKNPAIMIGFIIYQTVRYTSTLIGIFASKI